MICELRSTSYDFLVMNTTNDNTELVERFVAQVRGKLKGQLGRLPLRAVEELLVSMACHVSLRELKVANGAVVEPELAQLADAAVYFLNLANLNLEVSCHEE